MAVQGDLESIKLTSCKCTTARGFFCTNSLLLFSLPQHFLGASRGNGGNSIKRVYTVDLLFYSSNRSLRPYFAVHSSNPPQNQKPKFCSIQSFCTCRTSHGLTHTAMILLEPGPAQKEADQVCMLLNHILFPSQQETWSGVTC